MRVQKLFPMLFIICSFYLFSETYEIWFIDRDLQWPLEGVMVQLMGDDTQYHSDIEGKVEIELSEESQRHILIAQLPGYELIRQRLTPDTTQLRIEMVISGVIEGQELVVERSAVGISDEDSGVSISMSSEELHNTANLGVVEDVMSTIKTLPGVGFSGNFNARPSIRGGDPLTISAMLDGVAVTYPYHWGGSFSIFNPNMTESVKLSHGVFSSRYGRALSGILEVTTKDPGNELRANASVSTTSTDLFIELPLEKDMGCFFGGKVTYLDTVVWATGRQNEISVPPYIRDVYGKWYYRPNNRWKFSANSFLGTDGAAVDVTTESQGIQSDIDFAHLNLSSFITLGAQWSPTEKDLFSFSGGYNYNKIELEADIQYSGTRTYSDDFAQDYESLLLGATEYSLDGMGLQYTDTRNLYQGQTRLEWNRVLHEKHLLTLGLDEVFLYTEKTHFFEGYLDLYGVYGYRSFESQDEGNQNLNSSAYLIWDFGSEHSTLQGELGLRGEHYMLWKDDQFLQTYPVGNPRLQLRYSPPLESPVLDSCTISMGTGLFSQFPLETTSLFKEWDLPSMELGPNQSFYQIVGGEMNFLQNWSFKMEGYYKYFFNRLYVTTDENIQPLDYQIHQDGYGHSLGFDTILKKRLGQKLDGYISYSFVYTRLMNPYKPQNSERMVDPAGAPLNQWYYPDYHRFHTANLVMNWRFRPGWTFTLSGSYASGNPISDVGEIESYPVEYNGQIVERYRRDSWYSDSLRDDFSIPIDIRISFQTYGKGSKWKREFYFGIEDLLAGVYSPGGVSNFSTITGEEEPGGVDFNLGIPIPSVGFKASY